MNTSGGGLSGSQTFTANQTGNNTFTVALNSSTSAGNSTIVQRTSDGYIYANYFNTTPNDVSSGITKVCVETGNDGFIRHGTAAAVRSFINVANGATNTTNPNNATISIAAGTSLSGGGSFTTDQSGNGTITINHADTSSQGSVNNSGRTYIQDITLDTHGHITGITSATETAVSNVNRIIQVQTGANTVHQLGNTETMVLKTGSNISYTVDTPNQGDVTITATNTTYSAGTGLSLSGTTFNNTITNNNQLTNGAGYTTYSSNQATNNNSNVHFEGLMVGQTSGSTANTIRCVGDVVAYYSSDERLKDNITPIKNSLEKVGQLKGYEFDWNDKQEVYEGHDVGVIAQEVEKVVPEIVETREHDGYKAVKYEKLVPLLINAINELKAEVEELKSINKKV